MTILSVEGAIAGYSREEQILKGASIRVEPGEIVSIIGPNGAGKSTLLKVVAGLLKLGAGRVIFEDRAIESTDALSRAKAGIAFVPQEKNVFGTMTVAENLSISAFLEPAKATERSAAIYARYPMLAEKKGALARTLSGGQRQILAMAMGLMSAPKLLLLDEPTAGLSPNAAAELMDAILALNAGGLPILMVEQHALEALEISHRGYVLVAGRDTATGEGKALAADPEIRRLFLGG